jgi:hypothetical protein
MAANSAAKSVRGFSRTHHAEVLFVEFVEMFKAPNLPSTKRWLDRMPGAVWHPVEGAGHFVAVGSGDELFGIAAEEVGA